jgi:UDP-N-acetylglucosamine transferase subunit ALG13
MIFVTCGTQLPFDRLLYTVDDWAAKNPRCKVVYQSTLGDCLPKNGEFYDYLDPDKYNDFFDSAELIVCHAGMGTIISALEMKKKIIVLPRKFSLGEHRNDHQMATSKKVSKLPNLSVVYDESELSFEIDRMLNMCSSGGEYERSSESVDLCTFVDSFLRC